MLRNGADFEQAVVIEQGDAAAHAQTGQFLGDGAQHILLTGAPRRATSVATRMTEAQKTRARHDGR